MSNSPRHAFRKQRINTARRGIDFHFTFEEWVAWWETNLGPDWFKRRGCRKGQYVMARYYDDGPYIAHNVKCILSEDNIIEYNKRRKSVTTRGTRHLSKDVVVAIYLDESNYSLIARKFKVTKHRIQCIKQKHYYKKITDELDDSG